MSLRARLTLVAVALVAFGLVATELATYHYLSRSLIQRVDEQLAAAQVPAVGMFEHGGDFGGGPPGLSIPGGSYAQLVDPAGKVVRSAPIGPSPEGVAPATIPPALPGSPGGPPGGSITYTAPAPHGEHGDYRIRATAVTGGGTLIVAIPLTEVHATLRRLLGLETLIGIAVLIAVALLAGWLVRVGLRPLTGIGDTAGAIAAGDLTRRVEPADERTEVGRLGIALNTMLAHIEAAFEQRRRSEERLRRFVADASHELRTPLTSIRGYAELFRRGAESRPEDLAKSMSNIESEASRMGVLVDDLLLLARLDQGRPLEREPFDLAVIASEAVESAAAIDPDRTIELVADDPVRIVGDASRLRQVIDNLLDNAHVHAPGSPVRIEVSLQGEEALLRIADRGPGLDPDVEGRIFERFMRGDPSRSRGTGGVGLGLSIVQAIVAAHGGEVTASSGGQGGTVFDVRLPVDGPPEAPARPDASPTSRYPSASPSAG
jgi:two-component system, OmpR family, sensor kinase